MSLEPGQSLLHYRLVEQIGEGGMGVVWKAHDARLGRDVAVKVLPPEMSEDPERLARFEREARSLATLQHANIASIYGFEEVEGRHFLVMELVEGEDLSRRLQRGAIPAEESVDLAVQLADGLAAAHAVGIIHRDLKPANVQLSPDGKLKILDFGLARAAAGDDESTSGLEHSPTITAMTQVGVILGTAAYMSPEQARGTRVDHRADIWAFGAVLFEMLTGQKLFEGGTVSDTLAGVLRADVPWERLPQETAPTISRLLQRCLDRDPSHRLQSAAEARIALADLKAGRSDETAARTSPASGVGLGKERLVWIVVVALLLAVVGSLTFLDEPPPQQPLVQSTLMPPEGWDFAPASPPVVSPDGTRIAYVATARPENEQAAAGTNAIWIRDLASPEPRRLVDTDGDAYPFWSPDGRWIGFSAGGKLNKIEARGGPAIPLCDASDGRGGSWSQEGTIVFQQGWSESLMRVPAGGGTPEAVTTLNKDRFDIAHRWPHFLPDGRHFLYYVVSTNNPAASEHTGVYIGSLDSGESRMLFRSESRALYANGHLLYRSGPTLMARSFDASNQQLTGDAIPLATDVTGGVLSWGGAQFGVADGGPVVHMQGDEAAHTLLTWRDRSGGITGTIGEPAGQFEPSLSHDGSRVAVAVGSDVCDIWLFDLDRETRTRFTFDPSDDRNPIWSPDDELLAFTSGRSAEGEIWVRPTSGEGAAKLLYTANEQILLTDWSSDGRLIFFEKANPAGGSSEVWTFDVQSAETTLVLSGSWFGDAALSPDGKWLAFALFDASRSQVYVQAFPEASGRWMVSTDAGLTYANQPVWRDDGRELYYQRGDAILAVPVAADTTFSFGTPTPLFTVSVPVAKASYAAGEQGQRFLTNELPPADQGKSGARLIQNWTVALER